jgi:hypothetical protein
LAKKSEKIPRPLLNIIIRKLKIYVVCLCRCQDINSRIIYFKIIDRARTQIQTSVPTAHLLEHVQTQTQSHVPKRASPFGDLHLGICTTGDFEKNTFGDLPLGILKMTIGDSKITHICGLKNTFGTFGDVKK